jgi:phenylacetate-CoA ligase
MEAFPPGLAPEVVLAHQPMRLAKGLLAKYIIYPYGEARENRVIRTKLRWLRDNYSRSSQERIVATRKKLVDILSFAKLHVPYYRDMLTISSFEPEKLYEDIGYLNEIPLLSKEIIREQGDRMLSMPLNECRHYVCKTGGSTGQSCVIYYDQEAADYAAAVTLYARERIGKTMLDSELHFASRFPGHKDSNWRDKEFWKCLALNRSNIFFSSLDDASLEEIWRTLSRRKPHLIHEHSSTIYALACYVEKVYGHGSAFKIFESSGETLLPYMRKKIQEVFNCRIVNRYGLAEAGVIAYEFDNESETLSFLESECWPEEHAQDGCNELVITPLRNKLMPLIRYRTGDEASIVKGDDGISLQGVIGRMHDLVTVAGIPVPTHHIMDIMDHRIGNIQEFQIDISTSPSTLRLVIEPGIDPKVIRQKIDDIWPKAFHIEFVDHAGLARVGRHNKFRHVVGQ